MEHLLQQVFDIMPCQLDWCQPECSNGLAFWSAKPGDELEYQRTISPQSYLLHTAAPVVPSPVMDKLRVKSIIEKFSSPQIYLVQFWEPIQVNGSIFLSTADQLFVFPKLFDKSLCEYRRACLDTLIPIEGLHGPPARVFTRCLPEYNPDVQSYSAAEFPLRETAISLGIHSYYAFPLLTLHDGRCVGVFEIVPALTSLSLPEFLRALNFISAGLYSIFNTRDVFFGLPELALYDRLKKGLCEIFRIHSLPFAQIWIPFSQSDSFKVLYRARTSISKHGAPMHYQFKLVSEASLIESGKALVGRAFASQGSCFCKDVTLLSINEYPLVPIVRKARLTQSFAICLQSKCSKSFVCVVEYFLPPNEMVYAKTFLNMLLSTMEEQLPGFIVASGKELGQRMPVEVVKVSPSDGLDSFEIGQPLPSVQSLQHMGETTEIGQPLLSVQSLQDGGETTNIGQPLPSVQSLQDGGETTKIGQPLPSVQSLQDGGETTVIDSFCQLSNLHNGENNVAAALLVPSCSSHKRDSLNHERSVEVDPIGEAVTNRGKVNLDAAHGDHIEDKSEAMQLDSQFEQPNLEINSAGDETTNNEKIHSHNKNNVIQRIEKDHGITRKILEQHFGMTLEDAAKNLHVSRATLKRICREYNISRWPHHKTRKVNSHVSQGVSFQGAEPYVNDQQCPALSLEKDTDCLVHKRSTATGVPHDSLMTLKVTYRGDIIKFQLPLSSTRAELEGEVEKRLNISLEKFPIKYQDEEDEWILITTDSDLRDGMHSLRLLGRTTMRLLVTPEADA